MLKKIKKKYKIKIKINKVIIKLNLSDNIKRLNLNHL